MSWETGKTEPEKPKGKKKASQGLLDALKFIKPVVVKKGAAFCAIGGNWLVAYNETMTIGARIEEDLCACPQIKAFEAALKKTGDDLAITQLSDTQISVSSGALKALVPCVTFGELNPTGPDENIHEIDNSLVRAFRHLSPIPDEAQTDIRKASVFVKAFEAVATDGKALIEYMHGLKFPEMLIPKQSAVAISKVKKEMVGFGYSGPTATFWFEDDSFIKTRLYNEPYVEYKSFLECGQPETWEVPEDFSKAVKDVNQFSNSGRLYFKDGKICSEENVVESSTYSIDQLPDGMIFNSNLLLKVEKSFKEVYFDIEKKKAFFFAPNLRGTISAMVLQK